MEEIRLERGKRIPGSRFFRDYCTDCGTPLRVDSRFIKFNNYCEKCGPHEPRLQLQAPGRPLGSGRSIVQEYNLERISREE